MIRLKGELHPKLLMLGMKAGDKVNATIEKSKGAAHFSIRYNSYTVNCSVWPENYDIVKSKNHSHAGI